MKYKCFCFDEIFTKLQKQASSLFSLNKYLRKLNTSPFVRERRRAYGESSQDSTKKNCKSCYVIEFSLLTPNLIHILTTPSEYKLVHISPNCCVFKATTTPCDIISSVTCECNLNMFMNARPFLQKLN